MAFLLASPVHAAPKTITLATGGFDRSYVYTPAPGNTPVPVVLVLPDAGEDGATALARYRWSGLAAKAGFVAVGLDALPVEPLKPEMFQTNPYFWSDGSGRGNAKRGDLDDVAFVEAVLDDLGTRIKIDPKRIYATGFGNGGSMTHRLGMQLSDRIAAIAPVMGHLWSPAVPDRPLPVLMIYGASDAVDPILGGPGINVWTHNIENRPATTTTANNWQHAMGCKVGPLKTPQPKGVTDTSWSNCTGGASVDYLVVPGQGHHWPGGVEDDMSSLGPTVEALDATGFIWDWFKSHPKS